MSRTLTRVVVVALIGAAGFFSYQQLAREKPVEVRLIAAERGSVERSVANTRAGTVVACRRAGLSPSVSGQVTRLAVAEGDSVQTGQLLLELWNDDLRASVQLAESEARAARARSRASCAQAEIAEREAARMERLVPSGAASVDAIDRAHSEARARRASCEAAEAGAQVSAAQIGVARAQFARTLLHAPFDGVVAEVSAELNEVVTPSPVGVITPPAIDLIDNGCFYAKAPIDEIDAAAVRVGLPVRIALDAFGERRFEGRVRRISDYVLDREKQARTVDVEVEFNDPAVAGELLAGYSADVEIILETHENVLRLPSATVLEGQRVLLLNGDGRLVEREVGIGLTNWDHSEILSGLDDGEQVVENLGDEGIVAGALAAASGGAAAAK